MKQYEYAVFMTSETVLESFVKDTFTLIIIAFAVYISKDSTFYTFLTGTLLIVFAWIRVVSAINKKQTKFRSKEDLQKWVDGLPE